MTRSDRAHVPDDGAIGIEVGCPDEQPLAFDGLLRNLRQNVIGDVFVLIFASGALLVKDPLDSAPRRLCLL